MFISRCRLTLDHATQWVHDCRQFCCRGAADKLGYCMSSLGNCHSHLPTCPSTAQLSAQWYMLSENDSCHAGNATFTLQNSKCHQMQREFQSIAWVGKDTVLLPSMRSESTVPKPSNFIIIIVKKNISIAYSDRQKVTFPSLQYYSMYSTLAVTCRIIPP